MNASTGKTPILNTSATINYGYIYYTCAVFLLLLLLILLLLLLMLLLPECAVLEL